MKRNSGRKTPSLFGRSGLSEETIKARSGGANPNSLRMKQGTLVKVQFYTDPEDSAGFREFDRHVFQSANGWNYVPCINSGSSDNGCVPCQDETENVSKTSYAFAAQVYSHDEKKPAVMVDGSVTAKSILYQYKRNTSRFTKRVWEIVKLKSTPPSTQVDRGEVRAIDLSGIAPIDIDEFLKEEYDRWVSRNVKSRPSTLDDDDDMDDDDDLDDEEDDDEDEPEHWTRRQMREADWADLKEHARSWGVRLKTTNRRELIDAIEEAQDE